VEANLKRRILTALVIVPLVIYAVGWAQPAVFMAAVLALTFVALYEYFRMAFADSPGERPVGILFGLALAVYSVIPGMADGGPWLASLLVVVFSAYVFVSGNVYDKVNRLGWLLLGGLYIGLLMPHWVFLFRFPRGRLWVFFALGVIVAGDTAAYFVGRRFGVKKLAPQISPAKTWAGAWGYMFGGLAAGVLAACSILADYPLVEIVGMALLIALLGQIGDLFESLLKRAFNVKDSSSLVPGHGGVLDRLDSLIFPAVFVHVYLKVFHPL
jgi:phosphatidate cytidylyltransferase